MSRVAVKLPRRVLVKEVFSSRYEPGKRPVLWDERRSGYEKILTAEGEELELFSNGGQSTPAPGWQLLLTKEVLGRKDGAQTLAFAWTLYGISTGAASRL